MPVISSTEWVFYLMEARSSIMPQTFMNECVWWSKLLDNVIILMGSCTITCKECRNSTVDP